MDFSHQRHVDQARRVEQRFVGPLRIGTLEPVADRVVFEREEGMQQAEPEPQLPVTPVMSIPVTGVDGQEVVGGDAQSAVGEGAHLVLDRLAAAVNLRAVHQCVSC